MYDAARAAEDIFGGGRGSAGGDMGVGVNMIGIQEKEGAEREGKRRRWRDV